jgi:integration host factor subunit beta
MTRADLFRRLAQRRRLAKSQAELVVEAIFDCFVAAFGRGEKVEIRDFGSFSIRRYKGYQGRNPKTGAPVRVNPKRLPYFKPSKTFSTYLNRPASKAATTGFGEPPADIPSARLGREISA